MKNLIWLPFVILIFFLLTSCGESSPTETPCVPSVVEEVLSVPLTMTLLTNIREKSVYLCPGEKRDFLFRLPDDNFVKATITSYDRVDPSVYFDNMHARYSLNRSNLLIELRDKTKADSFVTFVGAAGVEKNTNKTRVDYMPANVRLSDLSNRTLVPMGTKQFFYSPVLWFEIENIDGEKINISIGNTKYEIKFGDTFYYNDKGILKPFVQLRGYSTNGKLQRYPTGEAEIMTL